MNKSEMSITMGKHIFTSEQFAGIKQHYFGHIKIIKVKLIEIFLSLGCMIAIMKWE